MVYYNYIERKPAMKIKTTITAPLKIAKGTRVIFLPAQKRTLNDRLTGWAWTAVINQITK